MPPPRGHNAVIGVRRPFVCLSVCLSVRLMSRTSALTRKPKGLGRRNFAWGTSIFFTEFRERDVFLSASLYFSKRGIYYAPA